MIRVPHKDILTKEEELRLVKGMEDSTLAIQRYLLEKNALKDILEALYKSVLSGTCDISYRSITRRKLKKFAVLRELKALINNLSFDALKKMNFNYLLCYNFAQEYLTKHRSQTLQSICDTYLRYRDTLINHNIRIAFQAKNALKLPMTPMSFDSDDVFMIAYEALVNASGRYDKKWNCRFYSYAMWSVLAAVYRFVREQSSTMIVPQSFHTKRRQALSTVNTIEQRLGRFVTPEELGISESNLPLRTGECELNNLIDCKDYDENVINRIIIIISKKARAVFNNEELLVFENDILKNDFPSEFSATPIKNLSVVREQMLRKFKNTRKGKHSRKK